MAAFPLSVQLVTALKSVLQFAPTYTAPPEAAPPANLTEGVVPPTALFVANVQLTAAKPWFGMSDIGLAIAPPYAEPPVRNVSSLLPPKAWLKLKVELSMFARP